MKSTPSIGSFLKDAFLVILVAILLPGCGILKKKEVPAGDPVSLSTKPLPPEEARSMLNTVSQNWFYGSGLGSTAANVGTIVLFPPYAIYVLGNAVIGLSGYEELYVSKLLPKEDEEDFNSVYQTVTSVPGKFTAAIAGREFRTPEGAKARVNEIIRSNNTSSGPINSAMVHQNQQVSLNSTQE